MAIAGAILGIFSFIIIYGVRILDFSYNDWLLQGTGRTGDLTQHYLGWVYMKDSSWSFPLGLIEGLSYPNKISIIYTDSIPLFAVFFRIFSFALPETFQYFGLFGLLCFALQGAISAIILRKFSENKILCLIGSLFFIFSPIVLQRMYYHTALAAHWIILSAIALWIYRNELKKITKLILWSVLTFLCATINLYFAPLVLGILFCAILQEIIEKRQWISQLITFVTPIVIMFLTMFIFGGFYGGVSSKMGGLGSFSFNINGLYNPQNNSYFVKTQELATTGQNEGYSYLGFGIILLLILSIFFSISKAIKKEKSKDVLYGKIPLTIAIIVFSILAISPIVTFNHTTLFTVHYPQWVLDILSIFRSSGRFIWPVFYIIYIYVIGTVISNKQTVSSMIILSLCFVIQFVDLSSVFKEKSELFKEEKSYQSELKSSQWDEYAKEYDHIMFYAPLWDLYVDPDIAYNFAVFAKKNNMTLNGTYFSRDMSEQINAITYKRFEELKNKSAPDDTLYIFPTNIPEGDYGLVYKEIDGYTVGIRK